MLLIHLVAMSGTYTAEVVYVLEWQWQTIADFQMSADAADQIAPKFKAIL